MKITEKNRSFVFLIGTVIAGLLFIGVLMLFESNDEGSVIRKEPPSGKYFTELEKKIDDLKNQNFNPGNYNTIAANVSSYLKQELITGSAKIYLMGKLNSVYSDLVYGRCESFLNGSNQDKSEDLLNWLTQVETITSRNIKIDDYRNQIKSYEYYSKFLPVKVHAFIDAGVTGFDEPTYLNYKKEIQDMPNLSPKYRSASKFSLIRKELIPLLEVAYNNWVGQ